MDFWNKQSPTVAKKLVYVYIYIYSYITKPYQTFQTQNRGSMVLD